MRIDAHLHLWRRSRGDYGWLTPTQGPLWRDFEPDDARAELAQARMDRAILVQAAPTEAETQHLLGIAAEQAWVLGVVGWTDFESANAHARIDALARIDDLVGLRPMIQDIDDDDWMLRPATQRAFSALAASRLVFDALVYPRHLWRLNRLLDAHPNLTVILDHAAKPTIAEGVCAAWLDPVAALAARPNVFCKLSGLITQAGQGWSTGQLAPFVTTLFALFGVERLIWGSDWPVCTLAGNYQTWLAAAEDLVRGYTDADGFAAVFGANALRVYGGRA